MNAMQGAHSSAGSGGGRRARRRGPPRRRRQSARRRRPERDVEATTRLGKRLLVGDRAPLLPNDGARFLEEASARGGAEAAAVLAVLFAVGGSAQHDLRAALESLVAAAERGWPAAQAQLRTLGAAAGGQRSSARAAPWRELAATIDLGWWTSARAGSRLSESADPRVRRSS